MEELRVAWDAARSIESLPKYAGRLWYIGKRILNDRIYLFYRDSSWNYWYKTMIITQDGIVSEFEAIFERKGRKHD